jgi:Phage terminase large subunit (GpA)
MTLNRFAFNSEFVYLRNKPISFDGRPYLRAVYESEAPRLVIRASRQVEKSTFLVNSILYLACASPGIHIVCVFPRQEQAHVFAHSRLQATIDGSPVIRRLLRGSKGLKLQVNNMQFANGSRVHIRAAYHTADAVRGLDADVLIIDEFQDVAAGALPVMEETLSHSPRPKLILTGTPKSVDNHLEAMYAASTACEWRVPCPDCGSGVLLDASSIGPTALVCSQCGEPIDPRQGAWVPHNPQSTWGDGFWINHLMVPWIDHAKILMRQTTYDPAAFRNECLGLPTTLGDHIVTREEVEACCSQDEMARSITDIHPTLRRRMLAGVDWGGGGVSRTVLAIGCVANNGRLVVQRIEALPAQEDPTLVVRSVAAWCQRLRVRCVAADGAGNGTVYNSLLLTHLPRLPRLYGIQYSATDHAPTLYRDRSWNWIVARSPRIGAVFSQIKKRQIAFPRLDQCTALLREIYCETAEYDPQKRSVKYRHPADQPDDTLHALNYLNVLARAWHKSAAVM